MKYSIYYILFILLFTSSANASSESFIQVEGALLYQDAMSREYLAILEPGFQLESLTIAFDAFRVYIGKIWDNQHEFRFLYAPLKIETSGHLNQSVNFNGKTFSPGEVSAIYKFNSYRLTYSYQFQPIDSWVLKLGGTVKIRDAEVALTQVSQSSSKKI